MDAHANDAPKMAKPIVIGTKRTLAAKCVEMTTLFYDPIVR
jgi:hypothetical protein